MRTKYKSAIEKLLKYRNELLEKDNINTDTDIFSYPLSFVLCCIADKNVDANIAWGIHNHIKFYSFEDISKFDKNAWEKILTKTEYNRPYKLAKEYVLAIDLIKKKYNGQVEKIWTESTSYSEIIAKLLEFQGVGVKIATMATNLLKRHFDVGKNFNDECFMDISPDTHVRQVFRKLGFIDNNIDNPAKEKNIIVYTARALNPKAPYLLDYPCFMIGKEFCKKKGKKKCSECPVSDCCQNREN